MKLHSLQLTNFRCFESLTVEFDPQLTVLVANNGMGKTAVLDPIAMGLSVFLSKLPFRKLSGRNPKETDIRIDKEGNKSDFLRIRLETVDGIAWDKSEYRYKAPSESISKPIGHAAISEYAQNIFRQWDNIGIQLPLIAFYETGRAVFDSAKVKRDIFEEIHVDKAYQDALTAKTNFRGFFRYFYFLEDKERRGQTEQRDWDYRLFEIDIIRTAISRMMPGFVNPHTELDPLCFMIDWERESQQQNLRIDQLSDGYRTTLAMVMDIASRIALLCKHSANNSPNIELALNTEGIVLIDEIDLHLHPSWQQTILPDLMRTFPSIQFIVTTHSPQVLTTVKRASIRNLEINEEGLFVARTPSEETLGVESQAVLNGIMKVNPIPPVEAADWYADYIGKIENGCHNDEDGQALRQKLLRLYGQTHTMMRDADRLIRFQEFKLRKKVGSTE